MRPVRAKLKSLDRIPDHQKCCQWKLDLLEKDKDRIFMLDLDDYVEDEPGSQLCQNCDARREVCKGYGEVGTGTVMHIDLVDLEID